MRNVRIRPVLGLVLGVACAAGAGAQTTTTPTTPSAQPMTSASGARSGASGQPSRADRQFMEQAAIGGLAEVQLAKMAQQKGSSDQVKQYAAHMERDHTSANAKLAQLAASKGVSLPTELDAEHKKAMTKLERLSGTAFDREYMDLMVADHRKTVDLFKKEASSGSDPELKAFASSTLPTLQEHLKMAQAAQSGTRNASTAPR